MKPIRVLVAGAVAIAASAAGSFEVHRLEMSHGQVASLDLSFTATCPGADHAVTGRLVFDVPAS